jgi:hypothetical protein
MYIVAIGWLYVTLLVAANEPTVVAGVISFLFYGLLPCSLLMWLGAPSPGDNAGHIANHSPTSA